MIVRALFAVFALALAACTSGPVAPDWQADAHSALGRFTSAYLSGNSRLADSDFARARSELARTGRFDLVARAELVRCAVRVASVEFNELSEFDECPGFAALARDAGASERAYAAFLNGQPGDPALLPQYYRAVLDGGSAGLDSIEAPLPRLIAAGVLLRSGRLAPADIELAVDTASAQGWRRPLLAWLGVLAQLADKTGDHELAARARRRSELVSGGR
jgi:hypothetical protein